MYTNIFDLVKSEETAYQLAIPVTENYDWSMYEHIRKAVNYKNSIYNTGKDENKPFKNIVRAILNLQYRAEGFDVKDILIYVDDSYNYFKSFLIRKFHEKWARQNNIDTFIDNIVESYVDFGGVLVKNIKKPEVVPLQQIAFCDQTNLLGGTFALKHNYTPEQLETEGNGKWDNIPELIALSKPESSTPNRGRKAKTPSKYIEVYEVHGVFPRHWLYDVQDNGQYAGKYFPEDDPNSQENDLVRQLHIIAFYTPRDGKNDKKGVTLYKGIEKDLNFKVLLRDEIFGRALGLGGVEELEQDQVWTNYAIIRQKDMLDAASKTLLQTDDPAFASRNKVQDMDNLEIAITADGKTIRQIDTRPVNLVAFETFVSQWEQHAKEMGSATGALLGQQNGGQRESYNAIALLTSQGQAIHDYRKGKIATFLSEIYFDWILPQMIKEINAGQTFLSELEMDELQEIADNLVTCEANDLIKEKILNGQTIDPQEIETFKQTVRQEFMKGGNKKFLEIFKGEMADLPMDIEIDIAGKQKDQAGQIDKLTKVLQLVFSTFNPQTGQFAVFQDPRMMTLFNQILEAQGMAQLSSFKPQDPQNPQTSQNSQAPQQPPTPQLTTPQPVPAGVPGMTGMPQR